MTNIPVQLNTESRLMSASRSTCIANMGLMGNPYVTRGSYLIQPDQHGIAYLPMFNCANPAYINSLAAKHEETQTKAVL